MKKVLFTISLLYGGGAERALSNIVSNFPDDWEIDILLNNKETIEFPYKGNIIPMGIPDFNKKKTVFYLIREIVKRIMYLIKLKKNNHYDACISFLDSSNISNVLSGNKHCKTIISMRLSTSSEKQGFFYHISVYLLMKLVYNHADKIVTVSKEIEEGMKTRFRIPARQITTIVNGYDIQSIMRQMREKPADVMPVREKKLVVTVGRLDSQKGQWHLIRAFTEVIKHVPDAVLYIIGTGKEKEYLKEVIHRNKLDHHVLLAGYCKNPFWYNAQAEVFVLPSMYEGFPNALAEAVCCEVPCIATDFHSGAREILAPDDMLGRQITGITETQYGILVPLCSGKKYNGSEPLETAEQLLAEAIRMLLTNEQKNQYYREQSRRRKETLGIQSVVREWVRVIEDDI